MIETKRMWLREATVDDIDQIIALEEHKDCLLYTSTLQTLIQEMFLAAPQDR